jgi:ribonuclease HII
MNFQEITQFEREVYNKGIKYVAGIDEVGRGPLAGPFVVVAVILNLEKIFNPNFQSNLKNIKDNNIKFPMNIGKNNTLNKKIITKEVSTNNDVLSEKKDLMETYMYTQIKDSKKLSAKKREYLSEFIKKEALSYTIEVFEPEDIDKVGIPKLTQEAFFKSVKDLKIKAQYVLTDMFEIDKITKEHQKNIINGDSKSITIASASIVAKVFRDNIMIEASKKYPKYGFDKHKGYGTRAHIEALYKFGPCEIHRKSYEPIKSILKK